MRANERAAVRTVVDEGVVRDIELVLRPGITCRAEGDHHRVLGRRCLLDEVADDDCDATGVELELVARPPGDLVRETVVKDEAFPRAALQQMPDVGVMEVTPPHEQSSDSARVQVMALAVAGAVAGELR